MENQVKINGLDLIELLCKRLKREGSTLHDYQILNKLRELSYTELREIITFGNVIKWHNEEITLNPI